MTDAALGWRQTAHPTIENRRQEQSAVNSDS